MATYKFIDKKKEEIAEKEKEIDEVKQEISEMKEEIEIEEIWLKFFEDLGDRLREGSESFEYTKLIIEGINLDLKRNEEATRTSVIVPKELADFVMQMKSKGFDKDDIFRRIARCGDSSFFRYAKTEIIPKGELTGEEFIVQEPAPEDMECQGELVAVYHQGECYLYEVGKFCRDIDPGYDSYVYALGSDKLLDVRQYFDRKENSDKGENPDKPKGKGNITLKRIADSIDRRFRGKDSIR